MSAAPVIVACLTPPGVGAIATIALQGPQAWELVQPLLRGRDLPSAIHHPPFLVGRLGADFTDRVVVTVTEVGPEQRVEIHCHGGVAVVRWLLGLVQERGAVVVSWQDWLRRTSPCPLQAEAAIALAHAPTLRTANILLDQYHGTLAQKLREIRTDLEAESTTAVAAELHRLIALLPLGRHLSQPWRVVLGGAPNVGKSSLLNTILGFQRSIISPLPGTTRDVVTALTALDGWPVELVDTAGAREAVVGLEAEGIRRAQAAWETADLCLWVCDRSEADPVLPPAALPAPWLPVLNKIDLPARGRTVDREGAVWAVSAHTGQGVPELLQAVAQRLVPQPPPSGAAVPFTEHISGRLVEAEGHLARGDSAAALACLRMLA